MLGKRKGKDGEEEKGTPLPFIEEPQAQSMHSPQLMAQSIAQSTVNGTVKAQSIGRIT